MVKSECEVPICHRPAQRGWPWCRTHKTRWLAGDLRPDEPIRPYRKQPDTCGVEGCRRKPHAHGLCALHLDRVCRLGYTYPQYRPGDPALRHLTMRSRGTMKR